MNAQRVLLTVTTILSVRIIPVPLSVCCQWRTETSVRMALTHAARTPTALTWKTATLAVVGMDSEEMEKLAEVYTITTMLYNSLVAGGFA